MPIVIVDTIGAALAYSNPSIFCSFFGCRNREFISGDFLGCVTFNTSSQLRIRTIILHRSGQLIGECRIDCRFFNGTGFFKERFPQR